MCGHLITVYLVKVFGGHREGLGGLKMSSISVQSHGRKAFWEPAAVFLKKRQDCDCSTVTGPKLDELPSSRAPLKVSRPVAVELFLYATQAV